MIEKLKSYASYLAGLAILVLSALLFRKSRQLDSTQSELAHEQNTTEITLNEEARKAAKQSADELVDAYEKLKNGRD